MASWRDAVLVSRPHIALRVRPAVRELCHGPVLYYGHDLHRRRLAAEHALARPDAAPGSVVPNGPAYLYSDAALRARQAGVADGKTGELPRIVS